MENINSTMRPNSSLSTLPLNKTAQFLFGLLIIFVAFKLWWSGWFSTRLMEASGMQAAETDALGSPSGLLPFVLDSVCLVGVLGFWALSFLRGWIVYFHGLIRARASEPTEQSLVDPIVTSRQLDPRKLAAVLDKFGMRLDQLEQLHPDAFPELVPEPTVEELLQEVRDLKQRLANENASRPDNQDSQS